MRWFKEWLLIAALLGSAPALTGCAAAPNQVDQESLVSNSRSTTAWFQDTVAGLKEQIDASGGFVVFPDVARFGVVLAGGAFGRGIVCQPDGTQIGWASVNNASLGLEAGVQGFKLLVVLQDPAALQKLKTQKLTGSVGAVFIAADRGASGVAPFDKGAAVYITDNKGLMAGVSIGLDYIRYEALKDSETPARLR